MKLFKVFFLISFSAQLVSAVRLSASFPHRKCFFSVANYNCKRYQTKIYILFFGLATSLT